MPNSQNSTRIDENKLSAFIGQILSDLGGGSSVGLVRLGDSLGLYKTLYAEGPMTAAELAGSRLRLLMSRNSLSI
jgi:hypothetical protein